MQLQETDRYSLTEDRPQTHTHTQPACTHSLSLHSRFGDDYYVAHLLRCVSWLRMPPTIPYLEVPGDRATLVSALEEQVRGCLAYSLVRPSPTHPSLSICAILFTQASPIYGIRASPMFTEAGHVLLTVSRLSLYPRPYMCPYGRRSSRTMTWCRPRPSRRSPTWRSSGGACPHSTTTSEPMNITRKGIDHGLGVNPPQPPHISPLNNLLPRALVWKGMPRPSTRCASG